MPYLTSLLTLLQFQVDVHHPRVELHILVDTGTMSIGRKMDHLYAICRGKYVAGLGDDDLVTNDYVESLLDAIDTEPEVDVVSFDHDYFVDGEWRAVIREGLDFKPGDREGEYLRNPSPKCAIRTEICRGVSHPELWHGEDTAFTQQVLPQLKTERRIDRVIYKYLYRGENKMFRRSQEKKGRGFR